MSQLETKPVECWTLLLLDDYSCPGFCSFSKPYIGTTSAIDEYMSAYRDKRLAHSDMIIRQQEAELAKLYVEHQTGRGRTLDEREWSRLAIGLGREMSLRDDAEMLQYDSAWHLYRSGKLDAPVAVAMSEQRLAYPVDVIGHRHVDTGKVDARTEKNSNGFDYSMSWDDAEVDIIWVHVRDRIQHYNAQWFRAISARFSNLMLEGGSPSMFAGLPEFYRFADDDRIMESRLFSTSTSFESESEAHEDMESFDADPMGGISFQPLLLEIVGDM